MKNRCTRFFHRGVSRARYYQPGTGRFWTKDAYEGNSVNPPSLHNYLYCQNNPVSGVDPSGRAVYFVEREMGLTGGGSLWYAGHSGHGYLLITPRTDPGRRDPFRDAPLFNGNIAFSWHPDVWDYHGRTPGRVWQNHPNDLDPFGRGTPYRAFLVTTNAADQATLLSTINAWIVAMRPGFDYGDPREDDRTPDPQNEIGEPHTRAPANGVYYSFTEQNCVWWTSIMLVQSGIRIPFMVQSEYLNYNQGVGAAAQVISGNRSATTANRLANPPIVSLGEPDDLAGTGLGGWSE